MYVIISPVYRN